MTDGWFAGLDTDDEAAAAERIASGRAETPDDWPATAVEADFAADTDEYYDRLHAATMTATAAAVTERERSDDQQLVHSAARSASSFAVRSQSAIARILCFNCWSSALSCS
jgi:nucleolar protein 56